MSKKAIGDLPPATNIGVNDLLVMEQSGTAKKLPGQLLIEMLDRNIVSYDGEIVASDAAGGAESEEAQEGYQLHLKLPHGPGIKRVEPPSNPGQPGAVDTYTLIGEDVRLTDRLIEGSAVGTFRVYNGMNGTGTVNSVANVQPNASTHDVPAAQLFNLIYPVGSVYISTVLINPDTIFGGTWERIQDTFLMAAGTNHSAGITHTNNENISLSKNQLPNEQLGIGFKYNLDGSGNLIATNTDGSENCPSSFKTAYNGNHSLYPGMYYDVGRFWPSDSTHKTSVFGLQYYDATSPGIYREPATLQTESINGGVTQQTIDIAPTYLTVYMWKRTALAT